MITLDYAALQVGHRRERDGVEEEIEPFSTAR